MDKVAFCATTLFEINNKNNISKGTQLSLWSDWSTCSTSRGGGEMIRSRVCLIGCEYSTEDLTQTQQCPGRTSEFRWKVRIKYFYVK